MKPLVDMDVTVTVACISQEHSRKKRCMVHPEMVGGKKKSSGLSDSLSRLRCHLPQESLPSGSSLQTWPCGLAPFLSFGLQSAPLTLSPTPYEVPIAERLAV